jgi:NAD(P)-dependent dehydrogenase (short-subunit alcohol dehydrogenase family)
VPDEGHVDADRPLASLLDLSGKTALVTGAAQGFGFACARRLAEAGSSVVLADVRRDRLEAAGGRLAGEGRPVAVAVGDVSTAEGAAGLVQVATERFGRLDVLVNNAGLNIPERRWSKLQPDGIQKIIGANLTGAFLVVQAALPLMRARGGVMIHTSSWAGRFIGPISGPAYMAAKHGVVAMSHSINLEEGKNGIRSSVLCPGEVATPILANRSPPETPEAMARMLQSEDMGELIAFIARQPPHVCINEVVISPTHNRGYRRLMEGR